jgi:multiple sugar transport system substrate-binding protein
MRNVSRLILLLMLAAAAMLMLLGPRADHDVPPNRVVIDYWEKWTGNEGAQMQRIVHDFNETVGREKGIYVRYLSISGVDRKTLTATAAGVPPDVAGLWDGQVAQFAAAEALMPLDDLAAEYGITRDYYKPVYWDACMHDGRLYALISTPAAVALHYNKRIFYEEAAKLLSAGVDPTRPPRRLDELDRYARALDTWTGNPPRIDRAGYLPMVPGWYITRTGLWFGGRSFDADSGRFTLTEPENILAFDWVRSYSLRLGADAVTEFRSGMGGFNSPNNPFLSGKVTMEQQGPWMANFIHNLKPPMSEVLVPYALEQFLPRVSRPFNYEWGVEAFPSAVEGLKDVTFAGFDVLVIPRGARHPREAFEFIAYVNRREVMERLVAMHCKNSPLAEISPDFIRTHANPYIAVFERLAGSPNAHSVDPVPIGPEAGDEMSVMAQKIHLLQQPPEHALREAEQRIEAKLERYRQQAEARRGGR